MIRKLYFSPFLQYFPPSLHGHYSLAYFIYLIAFHPPLHHAPPSVTSSPIPHSNILPLAYLLFTLFPVTLRVAALHITSFSHAYLSLTCASVMCLIFDSPDKHCSCKQCCWVDKYNDEKCILGVVAPSLLPPEAAAAKLCLTSRRLHNPLNDPLW